MNTNRNYQIPISTNFISTVDNMKPEIIFYPTLGYNIVKNQRTTAFELSAISPHDEIFISSCTNTPIIMAVLLR